MIRNIIPLFMIAIIFAACQSNPKKNNGEIDIVVDSNVVKVSETFCYKYIKNNDTASLNFISTNGITTGELNYNLYQKDKNIGLIEGEMRGDTLIAEYTFNAEGSESVREVVFLKDGDKLIEGFGEIEERNGKTFFKDRSKLSFNNSITFEKIDCR